MHLMLLAAAAAAAAGAMLLQMQREWIRTQSLAGPQAYSGGHCEQQALCVPL